MVGGTKFYRVILKASLGRNEQKATARATPRAKTKPSNKGKVKVKT
jgi:hypothetical protein